MLYKVWVTKAFMELPDRIVVVEAISIHGAIQSLKDWSCDSYCGTISEERTVISKDESNAQVDFYIRVPDGGMGWDKYVIVPVGDTKLFFLAEDWKLIFS